MKKTDYTNYPKRELNELIKGLKIRLMRTYHFTEGSKAEKPENRKRLRQEIARMKTELSRRKENG